MLVTGGAGFLGSHVVARAVADGWDVTVVDDLSRGRVVEGPFRLITGDVNDPGTLARIGAADVVVHAAAMCGVEQCLADPGRALDDYMGTRNVADYAVRHGVQRLVFLSSGEIYGSDAIGSKEEDDLRLWPLSEARTNYALSKLMGEALLRTLPLPTAVVRAYNIFGLGQTGPGVVANFVAWALREEPLQIYNSGNEVRAMCYVSDFVDGLFRVLATRSPHEVFNLGNPANAMTIRAIADAVLHTTRSGAGVEYVQKDYPDKRGVVPSIARAARVLGYRPIVTVEEGLRAMVTASSMPTGPGATVCLWPEWNRAPAMILPGAEGSREGMGFGLAEC